MNILQSILVPSSDQFSTKHPCGAGILPCKGVFFCRDLFDGVIKEGYNGTIWELCYYREYSIALISSQIVSITMATPPIKPYSTQLAPMRAFNGEGFAFG